MGLMSPAMMHRLQGQEMRGGGKQEGGCEVAASS